MEKNRKKGVNVKNTVHQPEDACTVAVAFIYLFISIKNVLEHSLRNTVHRWEPYSLKKKER